MNREISFEDQEWFLHTHSQRFAEAQFAELDEQPCSPVEDAFLNVGTDDLPSKVEVKTATIADWLIAIAKNPVPHVSGVKVVQLAEMPPEEWELVA